MCKGPVVGGSSKGREIAPYTPYLAICGLERPGPSCLLWEKKDRHPVTAPNPPLSLVPGLWG